MGTAGFSQSLPYGVGSQAVHFQRTNLVVRWKAPKHPWPNTIWTYNVVPTFSPTVISNLMALGSFSEKDKRDYGTNGVIFGQPNTTPHLDISFIEGELDYNGGSPRYSATNLAKNVPGTNQLFQLTTNFLPKLGLSLSELAKGVDGHPKVSSRGEDTDYSSFYVNGVEITNREYRLAHFVRALDGMEVKHDGGSGDICFGENARPIKIWLHWRSVERDKLYAAATPEKIIRWIRAGKAVQLPVGKWWNGSFIETPIDWQTVKSLTLTKATAYYTGEFFFGEREHRPILPSWMLPYAELSGTVDTGSGKIKVELWCPVIDETKPLR